MNLSVTPDAVELLAARNSLAAYAVAQKPDIELVPHIQIIIDHLEALERGDFRYLMVFVPPRYGKSTMCSKMLPAWWMGRHPADEVLLSSYSQELIEDFSIECRDYMATDFHRAIFPECQLDDRYVAKHDFRTSKRGAVRAVGRGGSITGRGASLYVIDDPEKDKAEATSPAEQRKLRLWFNTVVWTRQAPGARILMVKTRWDPDDLAGWELAEHGSDWKVLELPAIAERDEGWRTEGEALWETRFPLKELERIRDRLSRDEWMALYQQRPTRDGDETCFSASWVRDFTPKKNDADIRLMNGVILGDPASKKKKNRDRTGIWVVGLAPDQNFYFCDGVCDRYGLSERWQALKTLHQKWANRFRRLHVFWEEFGAASDIDYFQERMKIETYRFHIEAIGSNQISKEQLIRDFGQGICKDLRVYWNADIPTTVDGKRVNLTKWMIENEWAKYPAVRHDDALNAAAYISDSRFKKMFPKAPNTAGDIDQMLAAWKKRRAGITPMGA